MCCACAPARWDGCKYTRRTAEHGDTDRATTAAQTKLINYIWVLSLSSPLLLLLVLKLAGRYLGCLPPTIGLLPPTIGRLPPIIGRLPPTICLFLPQSSASGLRRACRGGCGESTVVSRFRSCPSFNSSVVVASISCRSFSLTECNKLSGQRMYRGAHFDPSQPGACTPKYILQHTAHHSQQNRNMFSR